LIHTRNINHGETKVSGLEVIEDNYLFNVKRGENNMVKIGIVKLNRKSSFVSILIVLGLALFFTGCSSSSNKKGPDVSNKLSFELAKKHIKMADGFQQIIGIEDMGDGSYKVHYYKLGWNPMSGRYIGTIAASAVFSRVTTEKGPKWVMFFDGVVNGYNAPKAYVITESAAESVELEAPAPPPPPPAE